MSFNKHMQTHEKEPKKDHAVVRNGKSDVVDRFLSVLWKREVELKLTTKQKIYLKEKKRNKEIIITYSHFYMIEGLIILI